MEDRLKEKKIEEMTKSCKNCVCNAVCDKKLDLKYFFDNHDCEYYQPKLPEGTVVLSSKQCVEIVQDNFNIGYERGSNETAEKILNLIETFCSDNEFIEIIKSVITKQFGVEIKEYE